jgi:hypothetical protein
MQSIKQFESESNEIYLARINFIENIKNKNKNKYSDKDLERFSKMWANIKYKQCRYSSKNYNLIRSFTKDLNLDIQEYFE